MSATFEVLRDRVQRDGMLLESDPFGPGVASLVAGERVRGSWQEHPLAGRIAEAMACLRADPDLAEFKLLDARNTIVHRGLWSAVVAIASAREPWQMVGLGEAELGLLATVEASGSVATGGEAAPPAAARRLERRLLVQGVQGDGPVPARCLFSWSRWSEDRGLDPESPGLSAARNELHRVLGRLNQAWGTRLRLPWPTG
ncbi:MAG: hypothetical protein ACYDGR_09030 [Candidatus Dormibacteria bacterium]